MDLRHIVYKHTDIDKLNKELFSSSKLRTKLLKQWTGIVSALNSESSSSSYNIQIFKVHKQLDMLDLGVLLMQAAIGGISIIDYNSYECNHNQCCCLYHCIELHESTIKNKFKLTNFINKNKFSQNFIDFLCLVTSFNFCKSFSISKIRQSKWITEKGKHQLEIGFDELMKLSKDFNHKPNLLGQETPMRRFDKLCETISLMLSGCDGYFRHNDISSSNTIFTYNNTDIEELSKETGIEKEIVVNKIKPLFDNYFSSVKK